MKAIVHHRYGTPDVLKLTDIEKPDIADDEVLVRVHAAGVDRGVWHLMAGLPYPHPPGRLWRARTEEPRAPAWMSPRRDRIIGRLCTAGG